MNCDSFHVAINLLCRNGNPVENLHRTKYGIRLKWNVFGTKQKQKQNAEERKNMHAMSEFRNEIL